MSFGVEALDKSVREKLAHLHRGAPQFESSPFWTLMGLAGGLLWITSGVVDRRFDNTARA